MKTKLLILFMIWALCISCNSNQPTETPTTVMKDALLRLSPKDLDYQRKSDSLMLVIANYLDSISTLQASLDTEKRRKDKTIGVTEMRRQLLEMEAMLGRAQEQIVVLEEKLTQQSEIISQHEAQAAASLETQTAIEPPDLNTIKLNNAGLKKLLEQLKIQIRQKEQEAALARKELKELKVTVNLLQTDVAHKEQIVSTQDEELEKTKQELLASQKKSKQIEIEKAQVQLSELLAKAKIEETSGDDGKKKKQFYQNALFFYRKAVEVCEKYNFERNDVDSKIRSLNKKLN
jgi:chromosome segregation ATPase